MIGWPIHASKVVDDEANNDENITEHDVDEGKDNEPRRDFVS